MLSRDDARPPGLLSMLAEALAVVVFNGAAAVALHVRERSA